MFDELSIMQWQKKHGRLGPGFPIYSPVLSHLKNSGEKTRF